MTETIYAERWSAQNQAPTRLLSESEATERFEGRVPEPKHWFTVARREVETGGHVTLEVVPRGAFLRATHLDPAGCVTTVFDFRENDGRLFWKTAVEYRYPEDGQFHSRSESLVLEETSFAPDGTVTMSTDIRSSDGVDVREFRGVDVSTHWLPLPEFGEWDEFMRLDRE